MNRIIYILLAIFIISCKGDSRELTQDELTKVESEVKVLFDDYFTAIRQDGLTAEFDYLDHSADFFWVPPGYETPISYDSVAAVLILSAPRFTAVENTIDTLRIIPLSLELASYTAKLRSVMKDTSGIVSSLNLIETGVVIKRKDGWKLLNGQTSLVR